jgi:hypothetical protein
MIRMIILRSMRFLLTVICFLLLACNSNSSQSTNNDYYPTYTKDLEDTVRTLDLTYIAWACECANWATEADINKAQNDLDKLAENSIFVEPSYSKLEMPDTLGYTGDLIRFTGQFYKQKGYPKKYPRTEMQVDKAKVFRYTKYQIIRSNYREAVGDTVAVKKIL